jgi:DNA-binding PadR family transcriptional regulator
MARQPGEIELRTRVLGLLARHEVYGYEVASELRASAAGFDLPDGVVYPTLRRLERDGLASGHWVEIGADVPRRRYYVLTPKGLAEVARHQPAPRPARAPRRLGEVRP